MADVSFEVTGVSKTPTRVDIKAWGIDLIVDEPSSAGGEVGGQIPSPACWRVCLVASML